MTGLPEVQTGNPDLQLILFFARQIWKQILQSQIFFLWKKTESVMCLQYPRQYHQYTKLILTPDRHHRDLASE